MKANIKPKITKRDIMEFFWKAYIETGVFSEELREWYFSQEYIESLRHKNEN